ncbi:MAG: DUF1572 family protein [Bacteroidetes bacterium]|nr:DUF1572 family protein [Bacteroidota bacterium]
MITTLAEFFDRDIKKVAEEISSYKTEENLWVINGAISNSAGNLALHLIGNLNHFIGATLGHSGYIRERDLEFSQKHIPRQHLISELNKTVQIVSKTFAEFPENKLKENFPLEKHGKIVTNEHMLFHLLAHLSYHLGQINYHRRLTDL